MRKLILIFDLDSIHDWDFRSRSNPSILDTLSSSKFISTENFGYNTVNFGEPYHLEIEEDDD